MSRDSPFGPTVDYDEDGTPRKIHVRYSPEDYEQTQRYLRFIPIDNVAHLSRIVGPLDREEFDRAIGAVRSLPFIDRIDLSEYTSEIADENGWSTDE